MLSLSVLQAQNPYKPNQSLPKWKARAEAFAAPRGSIPIKAYQQTITKVLARKSQPNKFRTNNKGWSPVGPTQVPPGYQMKGLGRVNNITFHPNDPNTLFACVSQGGLWKTTNRGQSWTPIGDNLPILRTSDLAIDPQNPDIMYLAVGDFGYIGFYLETNGRKRNTHFGLGIYKTTDGGTTWQPTGLTFTQNEQDGSLIKKIMIHPTQTNQLIAIGAKGIYKSTDSGVSWIKKYDGLVWDIEQAPNTSETLYASSGYLANIPSLGQAGILKTTDFGDNWQTLTTPIPKVGVAQRIELAIAPTDANYIYALACDLRNKFESLYRSTDGGITWEVRSSSSSGALNILGGSNGDPSDQRGQGTYDLALLVDPVDKERIYTGGINIWASSDGGTSWEAVSHWLNTYGVSVHADQHSFKYHPVNKEFYVCNDGGIYRTKEIKSVSWATLEAGNNCYDTNNQFIVGCNRLPTNWEDISSGLMVTAFYRMDLYQPDPTYMIAGCQDNATYLKTGESTWTNVFGGDGMDCKIDHQNRSTIYGSSQYGFVYKSTDEGKTFTNISENLLRNEVGFWTTPLHMNPNSSNEIYVALGNVHKSNSRGNDWNKISNFGNIPDANYPLPTSAMAISDDNKVFYVAKRSYPNFGLNSEVWSSKDGGTTWQNISNGLPNNLFPTSVALYPDNPNRVWITYSGFTAQNKVFESTDGGLTWNNISHDLPNIPVNSIAYQQSGNTLYIGTDAGVFYRQGDATAWEMYQENLPNVIVSDLEIHEATGKIYAATFGRGIWVADLAVQAVTSVTENLNLGVSLTPNPAHQEATITVQNFQGKNLKIELIDITGKQVFAEQVIVSQGTFQRSYALQPYRSGLYFIKLSHKKSTWVKRLLINR
ncbi:hypothetical protein BKI52_28535 [marine bacterium AO1-C]|nr:hypothetical protein BKI52_28535 [marine bacterium AO1-C]